MQTHGVERERTQTRLRQYETVESCTPTLDSHFMSLIVCVLCVLQVTGDGRRTVRCGQEVVLGAGRI